MIEAWKLLSLWAKKPKDDNPDEIIPLQEHLRNTADVARDLWRKWMPDILKKQLNERMLVFLAYAHDLGKASPVFQTKEGFNTPAVDEMIDSKLRKANFKLKEKYYYPTLTPHALVSFGILERHGFSDSISVVVGGHHGSPPTIDQIKYLSTYDDNCGFDEDSWTQAQSTLLNEALNYAGMPLDAAKNTTITRSQQVIYSGLVILADWIASGEQNVADVMPSIWIPEMSENIYKHRFEIENPRPVQTKLLEAAETSLSPGIFVVEAPMGEGKTEAALAAAEILANRSGCRGVYFALPSQATSNAMFTRVKSWIEHFENQDGALSIRLAHGKAELNEEYEGIKLSAYNSEDDGDSAVVVNDWLIGRKKGILADFTVGTIDHVLMAGLQQKHLALRHLGLANKVLIIDECHAYDVYMESYLLTAIKWLGAYGVPIIILSATLPIEKRKSLIEAYTGKKKRSEGMDANKNDSWTTSLAYPLITYSDEKEIKSLPIEMQISVRSKSVEIEMLTDDFKTLIEVISSALVGGGCAGLIFNTVKKAQKMYEQIVEHFGHDIVELFHAGFIAQDRSKREKGLLAELGKDSKQRPKKRIVIGTQVFEQSLDIDFDVMFSELCPIDLLLQRIGRLHRHDRELRPEAMAGPKCYVLGATWGSFDDGSKAVYGEYLLMRTYSVLEKWSSSISLPDDIPQLVAQVYNDDIDVCPPAEHAQDYEKACEEHNISVKDRVQRAKSYQIKGSLSDDDIVGWLKTFCEDNKGEAAVRDGADAIEVLLVQRRGGNLYLLPWVEEGKLIPICMLCDKLARAIAGCSVRLPLIFSLNRCRLEKTISYIENDMREANIVDSWYESYWLKGSLVLMLDEKMSAEIDGLHLHYSEQMGLQISKIG